MYNNIIINLIHSWDTFERSDITNIKINKQKY